MRKLIIKLIRWYQRNISSRTPPSCRFSPTCSNYTLEAVERFGCLYGCLIGLLRILRCCPLFPGGYDPVPQEKWSYFKSRRERKEKKKKRQ